jgi:hypothetical protein
LIRVENVAVTIASNPIYPTSVTLTGGVGRGYNTCNIDGVNLSGNVGDSVIVTINTQIFTFIVDEKHYGKNDKTNFTCKGEPVKLDDYSSADTIYTYQDSDTLIATESGTIPVVNNIPNIVFENKSYSKDSTPMSRILDMVNVVLGEAYEINGTLHLDLKKTIPAIPTIAYNFDDNSGDVLDYSFFDKRDKSLKAKEVLINPILDDIYTNPSCSLDFEGGSGIIYFNPSLSHGLNYSIEGLSAEPKLVSQKNESFQVTNGSSITTLGGIDEVLLLTLNGVPIPLADYTEYAGYNVISFSAPLTGEIVIQYKTQSVSVYATKTTDFSIIYQCSKIEDRLELDADNVVNAGSCYGKLIEPFTWENPSYAEINTGQDATLLFVEKKGSPVKVTVGTYPISGGGTLTVEYLHEGTPWVDTTWMGLITSTTVTKTEVKKGTIIYESTLAKYIVYLEKPIASINAILYGSQAISGYTYNAGTELPYIEFLATDVGKEVEISFDAQFDKLTIPAPLTGHPVSFADMIVCQGVATIEYNLAEETLCSLPTTFKIDVAGAFNREIQEVKGLTLTGTLGTLVVDTFGKVEVTVSTQAEFIINCDAIFVGATITVNSQGVT